ncbi:polyprenyl synthetase family protein [Agromyces sp. MMS24-JH15]|uniref:polyprenyl synthetase family protein n=1 Tax=Agromyces sp. MMS24-JH15 TaxID=3243765 RepID=UPI003748E56E
MHPAPVAAASVPMDLGGRVDVALGDPSTLAGDLWDAVSVRGIEAGGEFADLVDAARAADGGKYLRPRLVAAAYLAHGGTDAALLRRIAGAQQLVHLGLCIHDDLIDGDLVRHGRPNVVARAEAAARAAGLGDAASGRQGAASGLLAGDLALNAAALALVTAPAPDAVRARLAATALRAVERTIAGELLDVRSEALPPERSTPLLVARLKTASYSITLPLALGVIAAGADDAVTIDAVERVGAALGIAYQLGDDDLGLFGAPDVTGKSVLSDLRDGKRTEHIRLALRRSGDADRSTILRTLGSVDADDDDARRVRAIVTATGARAAVHALIDEHLDRGLRTARDHLPTPLADHLAELALALRHRTH